MWTVPGHLWHECGTLDREPMGSNCMRIKDTHCCRQSGHCSPRIGHNGIKTISGKWRRGSTGQAKDIHILPNDLQKYAEEFYTPGQYSDDLVESGTPAELARECVLAVVCSMSNRSSKHNRCAASHARATIALGMIAPLCSHYQPKTERTPKLTYNVSTGTFRGRIDLENSTNWYQGFDVVPQTPDSYKTYLHTAGRKIPYKTCPETDCEEVTTPGEPDTIIVEKFNLHNEPLWTNRVKAYRAWYDRVVGKSTWTWSADAGQSGQSS